MSAGRSSQFSACFSVERTKYLMLSKSMPDRSEPHAGIGFRPEYFIPLWPVLQHPLRLVLTSRDVADHLFGQSALGGRAGHVSVGPAELVRAQTLELVVSGGRHRWEPSGLVSTVVFLSVHVTCVVQIPSPCAIVARRRTGASSRRPNASVSASQSCGNSAATWATGQWCWQICAPLSANPLFAGPTAGAGPAAAA